jgi:hypothetical protein
MAGSREINAEHFVGVSAGSQIGAMGPGITAVGRPQISHHISLSSCSGQGGWRA